MFEHMYGVLNIDYLETQLESNLRDESFNLISLWLTIIFK